MSEERQKLVGQINAVKKAVAAKWAAGLLRRGGRDDSRYRTQKD